MVVEVLGATAVGRPWWHHEPLHRPRDWLPALEGFFVGGESKRRDALIEVAAGAPRVDDFLGVLVIGEVVGGRFDFGQRRFASLRGLTLAADPDEHRCDE